MQLSRITTTTLALAATLGLAAGCGPSEDPSEHAAKQAREMNKDMLSKEVVTVKAPVPAGTKIPCEELIELDEFNKYFEPEGKEQATVVLKDETDQVKDPEINARCAIVRPGTPPSVEEQKKALEKQLTLGVLPGEAWCYVYVGCSIITTEERFENACKGRNESANRDLGQFACVKTMIRGPKDAFNYKVMDQDTQCVLEIRGGHAVTDESIVQNCARAALASLDAEDLASYQK